MIDVIIPFDKRFKDFELEIKELYYENQTKITDTNSFEFIRDNTLFYAFVFSNELIGAIYYFLDDDNCLYLNAFSKRKKHLLNIQCLKKSLSWFSSDIYAECQNKASALCLLKVGFKRVRDNLFVFKHE